MKRESFLFLVFCLFFLSGSRLYSQNLSCPDRGDSDVYFCDPLTNGTTTGTAVGGRFLSEGFQILQNGDGLYYDTKKPVYKGRFSFWVKNIRLLNLESGDNHHLFEARSIDSCNWQLPDYFLGSLRIYSKQGENEPIFGQIKFEYGTYAPCGGEQKVPNWNYSNWVSDKWYHIEMVFDKSYGSLFIDGKEMSRINVDSSCAVSYRYFSLPIKWCVPSIEGVNEAIYAYVGFAGSSGEVPTDAGSDSMTDISKPDAGSDFEIIPVLEDHSVHKWEPSVHAADETVLDVAADENGNFDEGFYLKFRIGSVPEGYEVDEALIFLYCDYPKYPSAAEGGGGDIYFVPNNNWSEKSITWDNRPSFNPQKIDSQGIIKRGNWYRFDVSSVVKNNGTYSFAVMSYVGDGGHYLSKEGGANSGNGPYIRLHLVKSPSDESIPDTGYEDNAETDYYCFLCDDLVFPDEGWTDISPKDENNYYDAIVTDDDLFSLDGNSSGDDLSSGSKDAGSNDGRPDYVRDADDNSGCGCALLN